MPVRSILSRVTGRFQKWPRRSCRCAHPACAQSQRPDHPAHGMHYPTDNTFEHLEELVTKLSKKSGNPGPTVPGPLIVRSGPDGWLPAVSRTRARRMTGRPAECRSGSRPRHTRGPRRRRVPSGPARHRPSGGVPGKTRFRPGPVVGPRTYARIAGWTRKPGGRCLGRDQSPSRACRSLRASQNGIEIEVKVETHGQPPQPARPVAGV